MRVPFAIIVLALSLHKNNAFKLPKFFSWFLEFDDQNEIEESGHGLNTQRQSRGETHESFDNQAFKHQDIGAHHYAEDEPSDVTEHILPVFLIAFGASRVNSLFLFTFFFSFYTSFYWKRKFSIKRTKFAKLFGVIAPLDKVRIHPIRSKILNANEKCELFVY